MSEIKNQKPVVSKAEPSKAGRDRMAEVANTFEWLITAFILAFIFRAFVMEAFRIPTGSMADTLKGAHFRLRCPQCGYKYDYGFLPREYRMAQDSVPSGNVPIGPGSPRCPNCGYFLQDNSKIRIAGAGRITMPVSNGDRILVLKCIYQFFEPKPWDVTVFKNPSEPGINYIKRLIARPGETVEIIDGDVYINGRISRKPQKVQNELWMPVYNSDYRPVRPDEARFNRHTWRQPFQNTPNSEWKLSGTEATFRLDSPPDEIHTMVYDTKSGNDFRATYAYDVTSEYKDLPYCSDLLAGFYLTSARSSGLIGIVLRKYGTLYKAQLDLRGEMILTKVEDGKEPIELISRPIEPPAVNKPVLVKFTNVDHKLSFQAGDVQLCYDLGSGADDTGERLIGIEPQVMIYGSGQLAVSHTTISRDIHYTTFNSVNPSQSCRAAEGNSFTLNEDEFFVLGDNSPASADCRWWYRKGIGNNGRFYRVGVVPRNYLVGKAVFVYWPSGFKPFAGSRFAIVPNIGAMRFIYGGSNKNPR